MIINVGTGNPVKVKALIEVLEDYPIIFGNLEKIYEVDVNSEVSEQPKSFEEIVLGASNRAKNAFLDCDYSFGIESGLAEIPRTKTGYMDFCACAIYDGKQEYFGMSCGFEFPTEIIRRIFDEHIDVNEAFLRSGLTNLEKLGSTERGAIGMLTKNRVTRKEHIKQAIQMAIIPLENPDLYPK